MLTVEVSQFFDRAGMQRHAGNSTVSALRQIGGRVFRTARNSIRTRKKPSAPGSPPSSHSGWYKHQIIFGFDSLNPPSVMVGVPPGVRLQDASGPRMHRLHEFGGTRPQRRGAVIFYDRQRKEWTIKRGREVAEAMADRGKKDRRFVPMKAFSESKWAEAKDAVGFKDGGGAHYPARPTFGPALQKNLPWIREKFPSLFNSVWVAGEAGAFSKAMAV